MLPINFDGLGISSRIRNPLTINSIKSVGVHQCFGSGCEYLSRSLIACSRRKRNASFTTSANREQDLEAWMLSLLRHKSIQTTFCTINLDLGVGVLIVKLSPISILGSTAQRGKTYIYSSIRSHTARL